MSLCLDSVGTIDCLKVVKIETTHFVIVSISSHSLVMEKTNMTKRILIYIL